jgi:DNA-binding response OmpR family regulator
VSDLAQCARVALPFNFAWLASESLMTSIIGAEQLEHVWNQTMSDPAKPRILIVEDDEVTQHLMKRFLQRSGFDVIVADNGMEGFDRAVGDAPNLVLLDMMMPGMDGFGFLRQLRGSAVAGLPVIVTSALADPARQAQALELGASEYLVKTKFSLADLTDAIRRHLAA